MNRNTKLLICYHVGKRDGEHAQAFADKLHSSITGGPTIFSDGIGPYTKIIPETWDGDCNFAQIVKSFVTPPKREQQKYYLAAIIRVEKKQICGEVENSEIGTSRLVQGHRLIHKAEFVEESLRLSCEAAGGGVEMDGSDQAMPIEGGVSERGEVLRSMASEDRAAVLIERRVAHGMHAVFDGSTSIQEYRIREYRIQKYRIQE